jgi:hypothetical protein
MNLPEFRLLTSTIKIKVKLPLSKRIDLPLSKRKSNYCRDLDIVLQVCEVYQSRTL